MGTYFSRFGELSTVELIYGSNPKESRGFAFIEFKNLKNAIDCVNTPNQTIDGRRINCKYHLSLNEIKDREVFEKKCKIFVGGLLSTTTENDLIDYFSQYGKLVNCYLLLNKNTSKSRRFGFIHFEDEETVKKVL